jgi:predicted metalloprotease with PDZ domain
MTTRPAPRPVFCNAAFLILTTIATGPLSFAQEAARKPIALHVDLTDAPRHLLHAHLEIPVTPGPLTLEYPEWIPGDHRPSGPIDNLAGVFVRANGQEIPWRRDEVDMYAIHLDVPKDVSQLDVSLDFLAVPGATGSDEDGATDNNMAVLEWNSVVMYPANIPVSQIPITASLTVPEGWKFGTALTSMSQTGNTVSFTSTSLEQLVDSPVIAGKYFREIALAPEISPKHYIDITADVPEDLELKPAIVDSLSRLVRETGALYKSRHYGSYHFLLSMSDTVREEGLEHHQSSDNGIEEKGFSDDDLELTNADLLPHEFTHSWNGKYRRPIGLATPDYHVPMKDDLLWVYEGMTQYWGDVLAARSGFFTPDQYREALALSAATLDNQPGRTWRNLQDTAIASSFLRNWGNWRRDQEYYPEGELLWLDADTTIRNLTHDQKSLNDFCGKFLAIGGNTPPKVVPYNFDEIVADLNEVAPYDWRGFLTERLNSHADHAPLNGIEHGGYRLVYTDQPTSYEKAALGKHGTADAFFSAGLRISGDGEITDVRFDSPAFKAGLGPGMKVIAINGHGYSDDVLKTALKKSKDSKEPIELIVSNTDEFRIVPLDYHGGEKYPKLERVEGTPALLDEIIKPMTSAPAAVQAK